MKCLFDEWVACLLYSKLGIEKPASKATVLAGSFLLLCDEDSDVNDVFVIPAKPLSFGDMKGDAVM